jgi:hypothetical protein
LLDYIGAPHPGEFVHHSRQLDSRQLDSRQLDSRQLVKFWRLVNLPGCTAAIAACLLSVLVSVLVSILVSVLGSGAAAAGDLDPPTPAAFMPGGMLGLQIGASWSESKKNKSLQHLSCQTVEPKGEVDEVCFFNPAAASRVGGAEIHDGFIVGKGDRVVLIGTGISIKNADDPLAEAVVRSFQSQINATYQQTGDDVLFVHMPARHLTEQQMDGYSQRAPVLLVQLDPKTHRELAVLYGYLAPVNLFGAIGAE